MKKLIALLFKPPSKETGLNIFLVARNAMSFAILLNVPALLIIYLFVRNPTQDTNMFLMTCLLGFSFTFIAAFIGILISTIRFLKK